MDAVPLGWGGTQYLDARESRYETAMLELVALLNTASATPAKVQVSDFEPRNPYKGLRAFMSDDAHDFFGRDTLINELAVTLEGALASEEKNQQCARLLAVVGPSGSGKSSVVMAGLLPRLREGRLPGSEQRVYLDPIVPGTRPIEAVTLALSEFLPDKSLKAIREDLEDDTTRGLHLLATKLAKRPGTNVVLLVDQFEELFTQTFSEDERRHFLDLLVTAITESHGPIIVLLTLRADFYDRPLAYPALGQLIPSHQMVVLPMNIHEQREVIEKPAALPDVRLTFEGDLVGDLLFEVQGQVGALPLLQFTLDQLFQRRNGRQLTLATYREMGGVKGALARQAEETYATLPSDEYRKLARALFVRLIDSGASEQDTTRRRAALAEFSLTEAAQTRMLQEVSDAFIAARLLTTNEIGGTTTIEVSHEALIREWPRLAGWLREARDDIALQQTISNHVADWERRGKPRDRLYRGSQLKEARTWARRNTPSGDEVAFLRASTRQRIRARVITLAILLLLVIGIGTAMQLFLLLNSAPNPTHVTTLKDQGPGSLRQAIDVASSGSTITFATTLRGTIVLTNDDLSISKSLHIRGPGAGILAISNDSSEHGIHVLSGAIVSISGLTFKNSVSYQNSFIDNQGELTLASTVVTDNNGHGGGIDNSGTLTITNSIISDNSGFTSGGISNSFGGTLDITNSTISDNTAGMDGGGISSNSGTLDITNSTISGNTANGKGGGGISFNEDINSNPSPSFTITNSTISGNMTTGDGGGIDSPGGLLMFTNSTISGNTAFKSGGGIASDNYYLQFCTIYGNSSIDGSGGGIATILQNGPFFLVGFGIGESIVAGNHAHSDVNISGDFDSNGYNLFQDVSPSTISISSVHSTDMYKHMSDDLGIDPVLGKNGGPTQTHALFLGSLAIDRIPPNVCQIIGITTDQRGMKRPDDHESACDIGAYEFQDAHT